MDFWPKLSTDGPKLLNMNGKIAIQHAHTVKLFDTLVRLTTHLIQNEQADRHQNEDQAGTAPHSLCNWIIATEYN
jgi:hypothetical protein